MTRDLIQRTLHNGGGGESWRKGSRQGCEGLLNIFSATITARFQLESPVETLDVPDGVHSLNNLAEDGRARCGQIPRLRNGVHLGHAVSVAQPASDPPLRRWLARGNVGAAAMLPGNGAGTRGMGLYGYGECIHAGASSCVRGLAPGTVVSSGCKATSRIQRMRSVEEGWAAAGSAFQRERQLPLFYHPATHSFRQRSEQLEDRER
ncbi:hypothetical protein B0H13DRAFT_1861915 [Mycena leptocephala]|nr:hypothetical protein B0H13DRAFT_1861915 [Mycena leptocephala]